MVEPTPAQIIESVGGSVSNDVSECDVVVGAGRLAKLAPGAAA